MSRPALVSRPSSVTTQSKIIVLVTGGNAGIGLEIVKALSQLPNYQVLLGCRDVHKGEEAVSSLGAPPNINPIPLDINDDESVDHAFLAIQQHFGKLDILINNAAIGKRELPADATPRTIGTQIFATNVVSTASFTERMLPLLQTSSNASSPPKIIFVSSGAGSITKLTTREPVPDGFWYGSSKAALNWVTVYFARKFPEWKVNAVCPGLRATKINGEPLTEQTDPRLGAVRVMELVKQGAEGETMTYSNSEGAIPW